MEPCLTKTLLVSRRMFAALDGGKPPFRYISELAPTPLSTLELSFPGFAIHSQFTITIVSCRTRSLISHRTFSLISFQAMPPGCPSPSLSDRPLSPRPQVIEGQYVDQRKLLSLLRNVYGITNEGKNNFRVEVLSFPFASKCPVLTKATT